MKLIKSIPFIYTMIVIVNPVLNRFGIFYVHYSLLALGCVILFARYLNRNGLVFKNRDGFILSFFVYVIFLVFINILARLSDLLSIANSLAFFLIFPLFWFFYLKSLDIDLMKLAKAIVYLGLINGFVCIIQYFVSPTLFGIYSYSSYQLDLVGFRPGALLNSPQVYGLFVIMASIVSFEVYNKTKDKMFLIYGFAMIPLALLSGNKSVLFCIALYVLLNVRSFISAKNIFSGRAILIFTILVVNGFILVNFSAKNKTIASNLDRILYVFDNSEGLKKSETRGRLKIYGGFVNPFFENPEKIVVGNGIGFYSSKARNSDDLGERATESYILQVFGEYGIITLLLFMGIIVLSVYNAKKKPFGINIFNINLILCSTFIFVHAFSHPIFFLFWPFILFPIIRTEHTHTSNLNKPRVTELT